MTVEKHQIPSTGPAEAGPAACRRTQAAGCKQKLIRAAQMSVMPLVLVLALSVLGQAFLAGAAAAIDPAYWTLHKSWIAVFQWLSVLLAVAAWAGKQDALTRWLSTAPIVLIGLQYSFIHLAIRYGASGGAGLHAVAGF